MIYTEAERIGHLPDTPYTPCGIWLSFDYIIFTHIIESQWDINGQVSATHLIVFG